MALGNSKKIIVGAASVYLAPQVDDASEAIELPARESETPFRQTMDTATDWRNVGYTTDGLEVSTDPSYTDVEVDQLLDAAKIFKDGMGFSVSTSFAEATLENLLVAWGQTEDSLGIETGTAEEENVLEIQGGGLGDAPTERQLVALGNGPELTGSNQYSERFYHVVRVLSVEGSAHSLARAEATTIPVTFRCLPDDNGRYGTVRDRVVDRTVGAGE